MSCTGILFAISRSAPSLLSWPQQPTSKIANPSVSMLESIRRTAVEYGITFDSVLARTPQGRKPELLRLYPDPAMWPKMLGMLTAPADKAFSVHPDGSDYDPKAQGTLVFPDRCTLRLKPENYQTLLLERGLDDP